MYNFSFFLKSRPDYIKKPDVFKFRILSAPKRLISKKMQSVRKNQPQSDNIHIYTMQTAAWQVTVF